MLQQGWSPSIWWNVRICIDSKCTVLRCFLVVVVVFILVDIVDDADADDDSDNDDVAECKEDDDEEDDMLDFVGTFVLRTCNALFV